jgi:hypothetical protein
VIAVQQTPGTKSESAVRSPARADGRREPIQAPNRREAESLGQLWTPAIAALAELRIAREKLEELEQDWESGRRYARDHIDRIGGSLVFQAGPLIVPFQADGRSYAAQLRAALIRAAERALDGHVLMRVWEDKAIRYWPADLLTALYFQFLEDLLKLRWNGRRVCPGCHVEFSPRRRNQVFHDTDCQQRHYYRMRRSGKATR